MRTGPPGGNRFPPTTSTRRFALGALSLGLALLAFGGSASAKPVFGIVPQDGALPTTADLDLMPGAGIGGMRTILYWASIESTPGQYDWSGADAVIRETTKRGIQPLVFLYGTPVWAAHQDGRQCTGFDCAVYAPKRKPTRESFKAFAAAAAARYGPGGDFWEAPINPAPVVDSTTRGLLPDPPDEADGCLLQLPICGPTPPPPPPPLPDPPLPTEPPCDCTTPSPIRAWQIWNEQNSKKYFAPKVDVRGYANVLRSAAEGIRSVDPGADIVLGGMWGPNSAREVVTPTNTYLERLYALGAGDSFDSIAIHPYANNAKLSIAQLKSARRVVQRAGDADAGMWVTEIGWAGRGPSDNPYVKGLLGQARVLTRALSAFKRSSRSLNLRGVFWYSWRDIKGGDLICEWCGHAGLRTKNGAAKPAWQAFLRVIRS